MKGSKSLETHSKVYPARFFNSVYSIVRFAFRVVTFVILIVLACCPNVRRNYPSNLILLIVFVSSAAFIFIIIIGVFL
jgi:uncharacterized membrane protein